jgi:hypothetical protein
MTRYTSFRPTLKQRASRLGFPSRARAPFGAWRQGVLDLRAGGRRRELCLRLCADRAHHLHVDDLISGACG